MTPTLYTFYAPIDRTEMLNFIIDFKERHNGISPTVREIQTAMGISSTSIVSYHLNKLELDGFISYPLGAGASRGIAVTGYQFTEVHNDDNQSRTDSRNESDNGETAVFRHVENGDTSG